MGGPGDGIAVRAGAAAQVFVADPARPVLAGGDLHHLTRVLRLRSGEEVVAGDGRGTWCLCRFRGGPVDERTALEPDGDVRREAPESAPVTVAFAPAKGDRPEWVVQKLTEVGVDRIVRAGRRPLGGPLGRRARRQGRGAPRAGGERSGRAEPSGLAPRDPPAAVGARERGGSPAWPWPSAGARRPARRCARVAVGPEGGWSPAERALGLETVGLGEHVLRAETAAVAAAVLLCAGRSQRRAEGTVGPA